LQEALMLSEKHLPLEQKLRQARREGLIRSEYLGHQIEEAERAEVISKAEAAELRVYHEKVRFLMSVDDFSPDEIGRPGHNTDNPAVPEMAHEDAPVVPVSDEPQPKKAARTKTAKKSAKKAGRKKSATTS
jgi:hypothetical protein